MRQMYFRQRFFSWFDSYDIYDETGNPLFIVKGELAWGHQLRVYDAESGRELGLVKQRVLALLPKFEFYTFGDYIGSIQKAFTLLFQNYRLDYRGWQVEGDCFGWNYSVYENDTEVIGVSKELFRLTDTYRIQVWRDEDLLPALLVVLAIDAANCDK